MKNKISNGILGLIFIIIGLGFLGNVFDWWSFSIFFDGWWTLFIIIPCIYSMINHGINVGNLIGVGIGTVLLLSQLDIIDYKMGWKVLFPCAIILIGLSIIFKGFKPYSHRSVKIKSDDKLPNASAVFGGSEPNFDNMEFHGINSSAIFGGVDLNLRNAIITEDCAINCNAIFGGVDILLPPNVKVKIDVLPILGAVDNKYISASSETAPTIYVNATCVCGGIEIK